MAQTNTCSRYRLLGKIAENGRDLSSLDDEKMEKTQCACAIMEVGKCALEYKLAIKTGRQTDGRHTPPFDITMSTPNLTRYKLGVCDKITWN